MSVVLPAGEIVAERLALALAEDGFDRDVTCTAMFPALDLEPTGRFRLVSRQAGTFAGAAVLNALASRFSSRVAIRRSIDDGDAFAAGDSLGVIEGDVRTVLGFERTLLNFLQRLCGVATMTRRFVDAVAGTGVRIYDTRKTLPGWRELDKYAVRCGGGCNHRMGLHDAVLVKDNHLATVPLGRLAEVAGEIAERAARLQPRPAFVEIEVDSLEQFRQVLGVPGVDVILLDNFGLGAMSEAVSLRDDRGLRGRVELEVSGGVTLHTIEAIARTGVDRVAVGALTHSACAIDLGLDRAG